MYTSQMQFIHLMSHPKRVSRQIESRWTTGVKCASKLQCRFIQYWWYFFRNDAMRPT